MSHDASRTLFHPFETGDIPLPAEGTPVLFIGARPGFVLPEGFSRNATLVQGFRPDFLALQREGWQVLAEPEGDGYEVVLVLCGRHRGENDRWITNGLRRLTPNGLLVAAALKGDGADSLRRRWTARMREPSHLAKHHGVAFWGRRAVEAPAGEAQSDEMVEGRFLTRSGMFSHGEVDPASRLLADALPRDLKGAVADFGAGWGYLAIQVAEASPQVTTLHLYEADHAACEAARRNLVQVSSGRSVEVVWSDVTAEKPLRLYDAIVMNPPFHGRGREADPAIGAAMIRAAAAALKPGGRLFMVANRQLPYEAVLRSSFTRLDEVPGDGRFKLFAARR